MFHLFFLQMHNRFLWEFKEQIELHYKFNYNLHSLARKSNIASFVQQIKLELTLEIVVAGYIFLRFLAAYEQSTRNATCNNVFLVIL